MVNSKTFIQEIYLKFDVNCQLASIVSHTFYPMRERERELYAWIDKFNVMVLGVGVDHNDSQQAVQENSPPVSSLSDSVSCKYNQA